MHDVHITTIIHYDMKDYFVHNLNLNLNWSITKNIIFFSFSKLEVIIFFEWTQECQDGLNALKEKLTSFLCLLPPDWNKPFHVYCDVSEVVVGSALCQPNENGKDHPIAFASKQLTNVECNYTTME